MDIQKVKAKIKQQWKFLTILIISVIAILMTANYVLGITDKLYNKSETIEAQESVKDIKQGDKIEQKIVAAENNFQRVDIQFNPLKEETNVSGEITIGIQDENGQTIEEETIIRNNIRENTTYEFEFKRQKESKGKTYTLWIAFNNVEEGSKAFTVKYLQNGEGEQYTYTVNSESREGRIATQEFYFSTTKQVFFTVIALLISLYAIIISIYIYNKKGIKIENIFLFTVPVICLFYILCMPTFKNHDELYHWYRSYEVSIGKLVEGIDGDTLGTKMPENIVKPLTDDWTTITYGDVEAYLNLGLEPENETILYSETSAVYSFIQYLPQAIGIFITRLFTDKVLLLAYGGRIMNMIVSVGLVYLAIKKIPFGKKAILLLSYIPIAIEGFSSLSPDAMTISVAFLYIAYIMSLAFHKKDQIIGKKQIIILLVMSIVMALCKIVYIPLVLLMFIIPKEKFKNKQKMKPLIMIVAIACIINLIWLGFSSTYLRYFREGDSALQVKTVLMHPIEYIQNCLYTLVLNGDQYILTMFGGELGWGELVNVHTAVPYILFVLFIWIMLTDQTIKDRFKLYQKIMIALTILAVGGLIFTSLFVQWTTCGSDSIAGIQGRYFIPILPLLMLLVGSQIKLKTEYDNKNIQKSIGIIGTVLQIYVVLQIVITHL